MNNYKTFSIHQIGALITTIILAVWGIWVTWLHMTKPLGIDHTEIVFLSAVVPIYLILVPFYVLRVRWSYISGIIVTLRSERGPPYATTPMAWSYAARRPSCPKLP